MDDLDKSELLSRDSISGFAWIQFEFSRAQTIKAITMVGGGEPGMFGQGATAADSRKVEASDDGVNFKFVSNVPPGAILQQTMAIPETTAKFFRITVKNPPAERNGLAAMVGINSPLVTPPGTEISVIVFALQ